MSCKTGGMWGRRSPTHKMERYLIETPHTEQDCRLLIDQIYAMGYLYHFDWGCKAGVHSGWAIIEAENEADARLTVPPMVRNKAKVIQLTKFSRGFGSAHEMLEQNALSDKA
jgi:hypothetical protein